MNDERENVISCPVAYIHKQINPYPVNNPMNTMVKYTVRVLLSFALSAALFLILPLVQALFKDGQAESGQRDSAPKLLVEMHLKKKEEPRKQQRRMRQIQSAASKGKARSFDMKFTPDLGVGGGTMAFADGANLENVVFEEGETDEPAVPLSRMSIPYPPRAREAGIEGTLEIVILLDRKGAVASIEFVRIPHELFRRPVQDAVMKWKFRPAKQKGVPVNLRMRQVVEFKLEH